MAGGNAEPAGAHHHRTLDVVPDRFNQEEEVVKKGFAFADNYIVNVVDGNADDIGLITGQYGFNAFSAGQDVGPGSVVAGPAQCGIRKGNAQPETPGLVRCSDCY